MVNISALRLSFEKYFPQVLTLLYENVNNELSVAKNHFLKVFKYNVPNGKKLRGILCVAAFKDFATVHEQSDMLNNANLIGWCIEVMQAAFLIHDDLMDDSHLRRGQASWHVLQKQEHKGLISINDGLHLYMSVQQLLMKLLYKPETEILCLKMVKLFGDYANFTCFGQSLDILGSITSETFTHANEDELIKDENKISDCSSKSKIPRLSTGYFLTDILERAVAIAKWKTSCYSFVLPIKAGMLLAGVKSELLFENATAILLKIGEYFQAQDDFLDVYGDVSVVGKEGTDIADGKCSWLIGTAFKLASENQIAHLKENYGRADPNSVAIVKDIFDKLDMPTVYQTYENKIYAEIIDLIDRYSLPGEFKAETDKLPRTLFMSIVDIIHQRKK